MAVGTEIEYKKIAILDENQEVMVQSLNISHDDGRITLFGKDFRLLDHQKVVEAIGYSDQGVSPIKGKITLSTENQLNLEILHIGEQKERRNYLKVRADINGILLKARALGKSTKSFNFNSPIRVRDISLGGIGFYSNHRLLKGQKVVFRLDEISKGLTVEGEILRIKKEDYKRGYGFRYGCRFFPMNHKNEQLLCEYIFKKEIEIYRKQKLLEADK
ncbi:MAG: PilZ domain-containing protein [Anaerovoracaceae bacterium]|jgi:hypothetical protein